MTKKRGKRLSEPSLLIKVGVHRFTLLYIHPASSDWITAVNNRDDTHNMKLLSHHPSDKPLPRSTKDNPVCCLHLVPNCIPVITI